MHTFFLIQINIYTKYMMGNKMFTASVLCKTPFSGFTFSIIDKTYVEIDMK